MGLARTSRQPLLSQPNEKHRQGYEYCVIARLPWNKREPVTMTPFLSPQRGAARRGTALLDGYRLEPWISNFPRRCKYGSRARTAHVWIPARRKFTSNYGAKSRFRRFNRPRESFSTCLASFLKSRRKNRPGKNRPAPLFVRRKTFRARNVYKRYSEGFLSSARESKTTRVLQKKREENRRICIFVKCRLN